MNTLNPPAWRRGALAHKQEGCIFQSKHFAPFSEAARRARRVESSRLTCNFFHGAEDVEALRVHRSDTVVHIPVGDIETIYSPQGTNTRRG